MILPMKRVQLMGPRDQLGKALEFLQAKGALDLRAPEPEGFVHPSAPDPAHAGREASLQETLRRCEALSARLAPAAPGAAVPEALPEAGSAALLARLDALEKEIGALEARRAALGDEREATARFSRLVSALAPIEHGLDPALQPEYHGLVLRQDGEALALLRGEVRRITGGA